MKKNSWIFLILLFIAMGCQTNNIAVDYDHSTNFSNIKTYNYYNDNPIRLNQIDSANFIKTLDYALQSKGLTKDTNNPDVYVVILIESGEGKKTNTFNLGLGGGGRSFGLGTSIGIPISKKTMDYSIQLDFDKAETKTLIWTAKTSKSTSYNASSESKNALYKTSIESLLKKYPPKTETNKKQSYYD